MGATISQADPRRECPEVGILSNVKADGSYIGVPNAGQAWRSDMSYRDLRGLVNVPYGLTIPRRDGKILGGTEFSSILSPAPACFIATPATRRKSTAGTKPKTTS